MTAKILKSTTVYQMGGKNGRIWRMTMNHETGEMWCESSLPTRKRFGVKFRRHSGSGFPRPSAYLLQTLAQEQNVDLK